MERWKIELLLLTFVVSSCTKDKGVTNYENNYPEDISKIIVTKCATRGCHNYASKDAAAGLSLASWDELFEGGRNGPCIIPFRPDFSTLCFITNTFSELGPIQTPTMPFGKDPLNKEQYLSLRDWITNGAPDKSGKIKFGDNPFRKKIYVANRLCDVVTVIDAESKLPMRYVSVGNLTQTEFPESVKVSPDNSFWLVSFFSPTGIIQKFDANRDALTAQLELGPGNWSTFDITADSKYGFFIDDSDPGKIAYVDLKAMKLLKLFSTGIKYPKEILLNDAFQKAYIGTETGNFVYVMDYSDPMNIQVVRKTIDGTSMFSEQSSLDPHYFELSKDESKCFISCQASNEIRVVDMNNDSLLKIISLKSSPNRMSLSASKDLLFISCPNDSLSFKTTIGSVVIVNGANYSELKTVFTGFQPFGIAIDDDNKVVAVANGNLNNRGPKPHHTTGCGGRNGYMNYIDLNSLEVIPNKKFELAVFPCAVSMRK